MKASRKLSNFSGRLFLGDQILCKILFYLVSVCTSLLMRQFHFPLVSTGTQFPAQPAELRRLELSCTPVEIQLLLFRHTTLQ